MHNRSSSSTRHSLRTHFKQKRKARLVTRDAQWHCTWGTVHQRTDGTATGAAIRTWYTAGAIGNRVVACVKLIWTAARNPE